MKSRGRENERGMVRRPEMPLPHAISSWGGVGALHCQEGPQPSQHVPAQNGATISHPTQEQVELRRGGYFLELWQGAWLQAREHPGRQGCLTKREGLCAETPYTLFFKRSPLSKKHGCLSSSLLYPQQHLSPAVQASCQLTVLQDYAKFLSITLLPCFPNSNCILSLA